MRKRKKKTNIMEFSKKLIIVVVSATLLSMAVCLVGMFLDKNVEGMFIALCGILGGEVLTYSIKAFFGKYCEEKNKLVEELYTDKSEDTIE